MFTDSYVAEIRSLEEALLEAYRRLDDAADEEALHDLRIAVRRIRSLITPLRSQPESQALREAAAEVGRLTTPTRDLEVLIGELQQRGHQPLAEARHPRLQIEYQQIIAAQELQQLFAELERWPAAFSASKLGKDSHELKRIISKALVKQIGKLHAAVNDAEFDRHQLRILVKRTRYLTDAFPKLSPLPAAAANSLKKAQAALGVWHDHFQWGLTTQRESDLQPLALQWAEASEQELVEAEVALSELARVLPKGQKKEGK
ncbi:CHAD domain-containing protein [Halopseudomonas litoralis]|uniref:CHAD domain-containing protein n=1 Tax=Halopseudomonas litoralis TaxID=797277 RepID=UPI000B7DE5CC|nr:CHAD domain-containing protein [Halopseudomonas litoralis]